MKEKMKSSKGITLIALVITIIVLLILAAVTIATLTGENGILTKATTAKDNTQKEEEKEQMRLAYATALANNSNNLEVSAEELQKELEKLTSIEKIEGEEYFLAIQFTKTGNKYGINEDRRNNFDRKRGSNPKT